MSDTQMLERRVNSLFDENYPKAHALFRPTYERQGFVLRVGEDEVGSYVQYGNDPKKAKNDNAMANVKFYDRMLKEFSQLPEEIRKQLTLRIREPTDSLHSQPLLIRVGRTRESLPEYARHSIALHIKAVFDKYDAAATRIEYEGERRQEHKMPFMSSLETTNTQQYETARMYHFMHLGLSPFYKPARSPTPTVTEPCIDPKATTVAYRPDA
jgi:hypothetical protein